MVGDKLRHHRPDAVIVEPSVTAVFDYMKSNRHIHFPQRRFEQFTLVVGNLFVRVTMHNEKRRVVLCHVGYGIGLRRFVLVFENCAPMSAASGVLGLPTAKAFWRKSVGP